MNIVKLKTASVVTIMTITLFMAVGLIPPAGYADESGTQENAVRLENIVVTATKTSHTLEDVPVETLLITREDIKSSNVNTVSDLLGRIPGFNFSQQPDLTGSMGTKNTARGMNVEGRYLLVLVDGQRVFTGYRAGGMKAAGFSHNVNVVPVSMIERIEVVKGPGSALYGSDAMIGVMNIITRLPGDKAEVSAGGGYGFYTVDGNDYTFVEPEDTTRLFYEVHATVSGPINDKVRGALSFSHEENEGIWPASHDVYQNYVHGRLEMDLTEALQLRAGAEFTAWQEENSSLENKRTEQAPRFWLVADYDINPKHRLKLHPASRRRSSLTLDADFNTSQYGVQWGEVSYRDVELQYSGEIFEGNRLTLGAEYIEEELGTSQVDTSIVTTSVYLQDEWSLMDDSLVLVPGVRYDDNDVYGDETNPKFSAMFTPIAGTRFRASAGWSFKGPTAMETSATPIFHHAWWVVANPSLEPESAFTWQAGLEQELFHDDLVVGATYYHSDVDNLITTDATGELMEGLPVRQHQNVNEAEIQGAEVTAKARLLDELHLLLTYAYTDARDGSTDERLINTPEHAFSGQLDYDNVEYGFGGALSLSYTSDQVNPNYGLGGPLRTEDFMTVGLKVWKDFLDCGRISLEANNIFDEELRGSDTIYVARSFVVQVNFKF